jgi:protein TonB
MELIMIGKLPVVVIASSLSLAAHAGESAARPKPVNCIGPNYPKAWVEDDLQGTVRLSVLVAADGSVKEAKLVESSGYRALDKASLRASSTCKFAAASNYGERASGWTSLQFKWVTD